MKKLNLFIKRTVDIIGSLVGIFVLSIVFIVIAIAIKITSPGPIFFLQERLGMKGKPFRIIKFRTMIVNAEHLGEGLRVSSESDPRITKVGRILRRFSLDELPQIFNVLAGSMSFVGPRPPVSYYPYAGYENYPEWAKMRFEMRPGITGLAQATVRNSVSWDDRIKVDNQYTGGIVFGGNISCISGASECRCYIQYENARQRRAAGSDQSVLVFHLLPFAGDRGAVSQPLY